MKKDASSSQALNVNSTATTQKEHPWCNWFSSMSTRSYHFDVAFDEDMCEKGKCTAIELVRDKDNPRLNLHGGKAWLVMPGEEKGDDLQWSLYSPGPEVDRTRVIELLEAETIKLLGADKENPDTLQITLAQPTEKDEVGLIKPKEIFELEGGIYYDEQLLTKGFEKLTREQFEAIQNEAVKPSWRVSGQSKGKWVGGVGGALTVGGMYTAATITGVAVQTQALVGAAVVGVIGGAVGGFLAGGFIGLAIGATAVMFGYGQTKSGYKVTSAGRKVFQKLRCMPEFKRCPHNVVVPKTRKCPRK